MTSPSVKRRGRPPGSKNKRANLSAATVQQICEYHKYNPAEKLIGIANGTDKEQAWTLEQRYRANERLFDAIHNKKGMAGVEDDSNGAGTNYEIVFLESQGDFTVSGEGSAEILAQELPGESI